MRKNRKGYSARKRASRRKKKALNAVQPPLLRATAVSEGHGGFDAPGIAAIALAADDYDGPIPSTDPFEGQDRAESIADDIQPTHTSNGAAQTGPRSASPRPPLGQEWTLEAVRRVRFLMGQGYTRVAAQHEIQRLAGVTMEELQGWERELVKSSDFENDLLCSEFAGALFDQLKSSHFTSIPNYKSYGRYGNMFNLQRAATIARTINRTSLIDLRARLRRYKSLPPAL